MLGTVLVDEDVRKVQSQGFDRADKDLVLSLLSMSFEPGEDGTGRLTLVLAGDGAIALDVEALEVPEQPAAYLEQHPLPDAP